MAVVITLGCLVGSASLAGAARSVPGVLSADTAASVSAQESRDVTVEAEVGLNGVTPVSRSLPVRVIVTSTRARVLKLEVSYETGTRLMDIEVGADAPTKVDVSVPRTNFVDLSVRKADGSQLASKSVRIDPDPSKTLIGVGKAISSQGAPRSSPTIGSIQNATLVTLTPDVFARPGALDSLSGVVLSAADVDILDDHSQHLLREWVWDGGDLALDFGPREQLPVVELPADGLLTAVGSGWVRFTDGAAAAGQWSSVLEPSIVRSASGFDAGFGAMGMMGDFGDMGGGFGADFDDFSGDVIGDDMGRMGPFQNSLLRVGFIPTWVIVLAVFGTAVVAGPVAFYALRTRKRRRLMWLTAPATSLTVAALLLVTGQGVFASAETNVMAEVRSSQWASTGTVFSGLKQSTTLELKGTSELIAAQPDAVVTGSGDGRSVRIDLPRNSFGTVGIGPVELEEGPRIEVTAVATADGKADVSVTNHSTGMLTGVTVSANSRTRDFVAVGPNKTETLPFEMSSDIGTFASIFPDGMFMDSGPAAARMIGSGGSPQSRGLVLISGTVHAPVKSSGLSGDGVVTISSLVPVRGSADESAALRIDEVGGMSKQQRSEQRMNAMFSEEPDQGDLDQGDFGDMTTVAPVQPEAGPGFDQGFDDPGNGVVAAEPEYVRFAFPQGRATAPCGMSLVAPELSAWDGTNWVPLAKVDTPYPDKRLKNAIDQPSDMQDWMLPAVAPGGRLHLRITGREFLGPPVLLFDCGARP